MSDRSSSGNSDEAVAKRVREAGKRALKEAEERRKTRAEEPRPREIGGRDGPEPIRYGDWEKDGIASDF